MEFTSFGSTKLTLVCIEMKLQSDKMTLCHATLPPPYPPQPPPPGMFFSSRGWMGVEVLVERWHGTIFSSRGWGWRWWWKGWHGTKLFFDRTLFFDLQFKNTSNLILLGFKMSSKRFLFKNFKTDLTF